MNLSLLPPELLHTTGCFFINSVPSALLFASLSRKFHQVIFDPHSWIWRNLVRARWPGIISALDKALAQTSEEAICVDFELLCKLYRMELSREFAPNEIWPRAFEVSSLSQSAASLSIGGQLGVGGLVAQVGQPKEDPESVYVGDSVEPEKDLGQDETPGGGGGERKKILVGLSKEEREICVPRDAGNLFRSLAGKRIRIMSYGVRPGSGNSAPEAVRSLWFFGRFLFFRRREVRYDYHRFVLSVVFVPWENISSTKEVEVDETNVLETVPEPFRAEEMPSLRKMYLLGPKYFVDEAGKAYDERNRSFRKLTPTRVLRFVIKRDFDLTGSSYGGDHIAGVRLDRYMQAGDTKPVMENGLSDYLPSDCVCFSRLIHEKIRLWTLDGVLGLRSGLLFRRVIRFLFVLQTLPVDTLKLWTRKTEPKWARPENGFGVPDQSTRRSRRSRSRPRPGPMEWMEHVETPFPAPESDELFRRHFWYVVSWTTPGAGGIDKEYGIGALIVSGSGVVLELHSSKCQKRQGMFL